MSQITPTGSSRRRSRLGRYQHRTLALIVVLGVLMLADTLYLLACCAAEASGLDYFALTDISLPRFYQGMVLSHTGLGIFLVVLTLAFVEWHLPEVWRRHRRQAIATGLVTATLGVILLVSGLFILSEANNRDNASCLSPRWCFKYRSITSSRSGCSFNHSSPRRINLSISSSPTK